MDQQPTGKQSIIKTIYFYLVSFVALMMVVFSLADVINMALKTWIFTKADMDYYSMPVSIECDQNYKPITPDQVKPATPEECAQRAALQKKQDEDNRDSQRQRDAVRDISMIVVGIPLFAFHWWIIRKKENI